MSYVIVEWEDRGSISVINKAWLTPLKKEAFWPPCKEQKVFNKLIKELDPNIDDSWGIHRIKRCMFETDDFDKAIKKSKEAEDTSNLDSDEDLSKARRKWKKAKRALSSDEDEPIKTRQNLCLDAVRPPRLNFNNTQGVLQESPSSYLITPSHNFNTPTTSIPSSLCQIEGLNNGSAYSKENNRLDSSNKILALLYQIREQNEQILNHLNKKVPDAGAPVDLPVEIPLKELNQLNDLENFLKHDNNLSEVISYLSSLGGKDCTSKTNRILRHMVTDELASSFSFKGKKAKHPFCDLMLNEAIVRAVKKTINTTNTDVEGVIKIWLKHAPERFKKIKANIGGERRTF